MIEKVVHKYKLDEYDQVQADLKYWLSRPPEERVAAVEFYRRQVYGDLPRLQEWLELLNENKIEYVIVGAHALAFYGAPRFTGDLDILVKPDPENARKVIGALKKFGFGSLDISEKDLMEPDCVIQLGYPPVRIDLLTTLTGVAWEQIQSGKASGKFGSLNVFYLGKNELIANTAEIRISRILRPLRAGMPNYN